MGLTTSVAERRVFRLEPAEPDFKANDDKILW